MESEVATGRDTIRNILSLISKPRVSGPLLLFRGFIEVWRVFESEWKLKLINWDDSIIEVLGSVSGF